MTSELDNAILEKFKLPSVLQAVATTAMTDLYSGPVYTDGHGEWLCFGDAGARQFDFVRACNMLTDWINENVETSYFETWSGCFVSRADAEMECFYETCEVDRAYITKTLFGRELAVHV